MLFLVNGRDCRRLAVVCVEPPDLPTVPTAGPAVRRQQRDGAGLAGRPHQCARGHRPDVVLAKGSAQRGMGDFASGVGRWFTTLIDLGLRGLLSVHVLFPFPCAIVTGAGGSPSCPHAPQPPFTLTPTRLPPTHTTSPSP